MKEEVRGDHRNRGRTRMIISKGADLHRYLRTLQIPPSCECQVVKTAVTPEMKNYADNEGT